MINDYTQTFINYGLPNKFLSKDLVNFGSPEVAQGLRSYLENWPRLREAGMGLMLLGRPGSGKTMAATVLAKHLISRYNAACYIHSLDEIAEYLGSAWEGEEKKEVRDKHLYLCSALFIDNVPNMLNKSKQAKDVMLNVLKKRADLGNKVTFILSSMQEEKLPAFLGPELDSLLKEVVLPFRMEDKDYRADIRNQIKNIF